MYLSEEARADLGMDSQGREIGPCFECGKIHVVDELVELAEQMFVCTDCATCTMCGARAVTLCANCGDFICLQHANSHLIYADACPFCKSENIKMIELSITDFDGQHHEEYLRCQGCGEDFADSEAGSERTEILCFDCAEAKNVKPRCPMTAESTIALLKESIAAAKRK